MTRCGWPAIPTGRCSPFSKPAIAPPPTSATGTAPRSNARAASRGCPEPFRRPSRPRRKPQSRQRRPLRFRAAVERRDVGRVLEEGEIGGLEALVILRQRIGGHDPLQLGPVGVRRRGAAIAAAHQGLEVSEVLALIELDEAAELLLAEPAGDSAQEFSVAAFDAIDSQALCSARTGPMSPSLPGLSRVRSRQLLGIGGAVHPVQALRIRDHGHETGRSAPRWQVAAAWAAVAWTASASTSVPINVNFLNMLDLPERK